jgi:hypothetical protein
MAQGLLRYLTLISPIPRFLGRGSSPRVAQTPEDQSPGAERTCIPSVEFRQTSAIEIIPPLLATVRVLSRHLSLATCSPAC